MSDGFEFESPLGSLGWIVDSLFLKSSMRRFLVTRISRRLPLPPGCTATSQINNINK